MSTSGNTPDPRATVAVVTGSSRGGGRAIAALAADPAVLDKSEQMLTAGDLARAYGFTDLDGRQPEPFRIPTETTHASRIASWIGG